MDSRHSSTELTNVVFAHVNTFLSDEYYHNIVVFRLTWHVDSTEYISVFADARHTYGEYMPLAYGTLSLRGFFESHGQT